MRIIFEAILFISNIICTDINGQDSGGWYEISSGTLDNGYRDSKLAPSLNAPGFTDTDSYVCGISGTTRNDGNDGVWQLGVIFCHKYDTSVTSESLLFENVDNQGVTKFSSQCPSGQFVTSIQLKADGSGLCGTQDGVTGAKFRCSNYPGYSTGIHSSWITAKETGSGSWKTAYTHSTKLMCGAAASFGKTSCFLYSDDLGADKVKFKFCSVYDCRSTISATATIPDQQYYVNHGNEYSLVSQYVYGERYIYYGWFNSFWSNSDTTNCPFTSCSLVGTTSEVTLHTWGNDNNEMLKINQDPRAEYSISLKVQCQNKENVSLRQSNSFKITVSCSSNISIALPASFQQEQQGEATTVIANWNQFDFGSFDTYTSACQLDYYEVYRTENLLINPIGLAVNTYDEPQATGTLNQNWYAVKVLDGEKPYQYKFKIKAYVMGGNTFWTPELVLTTYCPSEVPVEPQSMLSTYFQTCTGADMIGTGDGARYNFPTYSPTLPMCNQVLDYSMINVSPSSSLLTYPSPTCNGAMCNTIDFDVSTTQTITFQINITTSMNSGTSATTSLISIDIQAVCVELTITPSGVVDLAGNTQITSGEYQLTIGSGTQYFYFNVFTCSTGCGISYQVSPATTGLGAPEFDQGTNMMKISVSDTALMTFTFKIYGELQQQTTVNALTPDIKISIVCGSEQITVSKTSLVLNPFDMLSGTSQTIRLDQSYSEFGSVSISSLFASTVQLCPLWQFSLYKDITNTLLWSSSGDSSDSNIQFVAGSPISSSYITLNIQSPFRKTVQIKGQSQFGRYNYLALDITICGNEVITSQTLTTATSKMVFDLNDEFSIPYSQYVYWFELTNAEHTDCSQISYQLKQGVNCDQSLDSDNQARFSMNAQKTIEFNLNTPFEVQYMCLEATSTKGFVKAHQILEVEVCGSEIISLQDDNQMTIVTKHYDYNSGSSGVQQIYPGNEGFNFVSNRTNCPPYSYRLLLADQSTVYSGSQISLSGPVTGIDISVTTLTPLYQQIYYVEVQSKNSPNLAFLPLNISICGFESLSSSAAREFYFPYGSSWKYIYRDFYTGFFKNSHSSECPIYSYEIEFNQTILINYQEIVWRIQLDDNGDLAIDTEVQEEHQQIMETLKERYKVQIDLKIVPFNLTAKSRGNVKVSQQLFAVFLSQDELKFLNQAPNFERPLIKQTVQVLEDNKQSQESHHQYQTPKLVDMEEDNISYEIKDMPNYMDCKFNSTSGGLNFIIFKTAIVEQDKGDHNLTIILSDDSKKSTPRKVLFFYNINYQKANLALKSYNQKLPEECMPLSQVTEVLIICPTSRQLYFDICNDLIIPSRIRSEDTEEYTGILQEVTVHYDYDVFQELLVKINQVYAFTADDFYATINEVQISFTGTLYNETDPGYTPAKVCTHIATMENNGNSYETMKNEIDKIKSKFLVYINNALIFSEDDLLALTGVQGNKEQKIIWPFISQVKFNKDLSLNVIISENLLVMKQEYNILIDESILEVSIESAVNRRVSFMGRRLNNQSSETLDNYLNYLRDENGYESDEFELLKDLAFEWDLNIYQEDKMIIKIIPYYRKRFSLTPFGMDKIVFRMNPNSVVRSRMTGLTLEEKSLLERSFTFKIPPVFEEQESLETGFNIAYNFAIALQASTFVLNIFLSKTLQDLWSLLNTISLVIHVPLINMSVPGNALFMMELMGQLTQKDMYPTDEIYGILFNFTEKGYPDQEEEVEEVEFNPNITIEARRMQEEYQSGLPEEIATSGYDLLGYDEANFIPLSGSGLINILIAIVSMVFYNTIRWLCRRFHEYKFARRVGIQFPKVNHFIGLVRFFFEGYLELFLSALISVTTLTKDDFSDNPSDIFSASFACISLLILFVLPIYMIYIIRKHQGNLEDEEVTYNYGLFYQDLKIDNFNRSIFHVIFIMRRFIYVLTILFLTNYPNIQLIIITKLSIGYLCYLIHWMPFAEKDLNDGEIFNELSIYLVQLSFLVMHGVIEGKTEIGWVYIGVCVFNLGVNLMRIARVLVYEYIPDRYQVMLEYFEQKKYQRMKVQYLKEKEEMVRLFPAKRRYRVQVEITQLTYEMQELEPQIKSFTKMINEEATWLISNNIVVGEILTPQIQQLDALILHHKKLKKRFKNRQKEFRKIIMRTRGAEFFQKVIEEIETAQQQRAQDDAIKIVTEEEQIRDEIKNKLDMMVQERFKAKMLLKKQKTRESPSIDEEEKSEIKKARYIRNSKHRVRENSRDNTPRERSNPRDKTVRERSNSIDSTERIRIELKALANMKKKKPDKKVRFHTEV